MSICQLRYVLFDNIFYHLCCSKKKYPWTYAKSVNPDQKPHVSESVVPCRNYLSRLFWTKFLSEKKEKIESFLPELLSSSRTVLVFVSF